MAYDNPKGLIAMSVILSLLSLTCVGLRFLSRRKRKAPLATDDWLILAAVTCGTGLSIMEIYGAAVQALGVPLNATIEDPAAVTSRLNKTKHIELAFLLLGIFTLGLIKLSIGFLLRRIFSKPVFRWIINVWLLIVLGWTASFVIAGLAECGSHLKALFGTPQAYLNRCGSAIPTGWAMVGSDVATDLIAIILPIPMIWTLHMSTARKLGLAAIFAVGLLSLGASIAKTYIYVAGSLGLYQADAILLLTGLSVWNLIEVQVGIMVACAPTLRPVVTEMLPVESLSNLIRTIKDRISTSKSSHGSQRLPPHTKSGDPSNREVSQEHLVEAPGLRGMAQPLGRSEEYEMRATKRSMQPNEIHVHKSLAVESV